MARVAVILALPVVAAVHAHPAVRALGVKRTAGSPPLPSADILTWTEQEIGAMISFDMVTILVNVTNKQHFCFGVGGDSGFAMPPPSTYAPANLSTDSWIQAAQAFGAKYAVFTTMHCSGFAQWATDVMNATGFNYTYSTLYAPQLPSGSHDVVANFVASCAKFGVKPGFYYSLNQNAYLNVGRGSVLPGPLNPGQVNVSQAEYISIAVAQQIELWSRYAGQLFEIWFDGGDDLPGVNAALAQYQPQAVYFGGSASYNNLRWIGTESGLPSYPVWSTVAQGDNGNGSPGGDAFIPAESDTTANPFDSWFWTPGYALRSLSDLQDVYHSTVGANSNMLLNIAPDATGAVPSDAMALYTAFGDWVRACYGSPVASASPPPGAVVTLTLPSASTIDRVIAMEDQSGGEQVAAFTVTVMSNGAWVNAGSGSAIGHKRIHRFLLPAPNVTQIVLNVTATTQGQALSSVKWVSFAAVDGPAAGC